MDDLNWQPAKKPERAPLMGDSVVLEPLDVPRHGEDLYASTAAADSTWDYLPYGPFASKDDFLAWLAQRAPVDDPLTFTIGLGGSMILGPPPELVTVMLALAVP